MKQRIVFTGGGTAGHVIPNLPLIEACKRLNWQVDYIGSGVGVEKSLISTTSVPFHAISSGKLRRYFSWQNFLDPFKILLGIYQSFWILRRLSPQVVFSKGGFVAFPVVFGAWLNRIPVVAHESDMSIGLANTLCFPFVKKLCVTFENAKKSIKNKDKVMVTGTPFRTELLHGDKEKGLKWIGFKAEKPCLLVMGGSSGAETINRCIREALPDLTAFYQVIHLCGKGKLDLSLQDVEGYCQLEYVHAELADLYACSEVVVSRSGANSLYEILILEKPHILVPLSVGSRGDQIQNARYFQKKEISLVISDSDLNPKNLLQNLAALSENKNTIIEKIKALKLGSATDKIMSLLCELSENTYVFKKNKKILDKR